MTNVLRKLVSQLGVYAPLPSLCERACSLLESATSDIGTGIVLSNNRWRRLLVAVAQCLPKACA